MKAISRFDIFCRVIDNLGDAGICWRLARQLAHEYSIYVRLWIDDLATLKKMCAAVRPDADEQFISGVCIRKWPSAFPLLPVSDLPDAVVEGFGCGLPESCMAALTQAVKPPVWINMEYLSAESWVDGCHKMPSPQSSNALIRYFFFPGFSSGTAGLIRETGLLKKRNEFLADNRNAQDFLARLNVGKHDNELVMSLFCYDFAPVLPLFDAIRRKGLQILCLVPEGVASVAVSTFLGEPAVAGARKTQDFLTIQVISLVDQDDYDRLLWSCDFNFVRGEDSFVRAQWAGKPFVWQIYRQKEEAHVSKLEAFLDLYLEKMDTRLALLVRQSWCAWNAITENTAAIEKERALPLPELMQQIPLLTQHGVKWADYLASRKDFASSLVRFTQSLR